MRFTRVTLFFIAFIMAMGFYQLARHFLAEVEPQTFQATEEVMVDTANLLAEVVAAEMVDDAFRTDSLQTAFENAHQRKLKARLFEHLKTKVGLNAYLTDSRGRVVFDSDGGRREGEDLSEQNDVMRTLSGRYGARSSREEEKDANSSILYVAAPVGDPQKPVGVLTVYKAQRDVLPLVRERQRIIYYACGMIGSGILFLIAAVFLWLFRPIGRITEYARAIERGERPAKPKIGIGREVNTLAHALDSMRDALEGRRYAERYIQTLTHEMKSPLAAIRGAAELLDEEMPPATRQRFLENIRAETARSERLINRMLELSAIESRTRLEAPEEVDFAALVAQAIDQVRPLAEVAGVGIRWEEGEEGQAGRLSAVTGETPVLHAVTGEKPVLHGDAFILRAAVTNLLENAVDFSPKDGVIEVNLRLINGWAELTIRDYGPGIPDYARERVFERFYSLRHHSVGRKGTGLGLTLVREAADLHRGTIALESAVGGGTVARFSLPLG
jgi:two-component system sensor histidine kinase CreC